MKKSTNKYNYCKLHFVLNLFLLLLLIKFGNSFIIRTFTKVLQGKHPTKT